MEQLLVLAAVKALGPKVSLTAIQVAIPVAVRVIPAAYRRVRSR